MNRNQGYPNLSALLRHRPHAWARVLGSERYPNIEGNVWFYQSEYGVLVVAEFLGLPDSKEPCESPIFAFHIHAGERCTGNSDDPFFDVGGHYNPYSCPHPYHAGDLPPLFGAGGVAFSAVLTDRITVQEIVGRTVILHRMPDDFRTQPAGNAGEKIACGEIVG